MTIRIHRNSEFINRYLSCCRQRIRNIRREVRIIYVYRVVYCIYNQMEKYRICSALLYMYFINVFIIWYTFQWLY